MAKALGATEIVIDPTDARSDKWPRDAVMRRLESILLPGAEFAGLPSRLGTDGDVLDHPDISRLIAFVRGGGKIERLRSVLPPGESKYTVTLRKTSRAPERNSNEGDWRNFANSIGARVIEDYDTHPIGIQERMALYAGAEMNFFVVSGPSHLCSLAGLPCMIFAATESEAHFRKRGIERGQNWPWAVDGQYLIWEPDNLASLSRHFNMWKSQ